MILHHSLLRLVDRRIDATVRSAAIKRSWTVQTAAVSVGDIFCVHNTVYIRPTVMAWKSG